MCVGRRQFAEGPGQCVASSQRALTGTAQQIKRAVARTSLLIGQCAAHITILSSARHSQNFFFFFPPC